MAYNFLLSDDDTQKLSDGEGAVEETGDDLGNDDPHSADLDSEEDEIEEE